MVCLRKHGNFAPGEKMSKTLVNSKQFDVDCETPRYSGVKVTIVFNLRRKIRQRFKINIGKRKAHCSMTKA